MQCIKTFTGSLGCCHKLATDEAVSGVIFDLQLFSGEKTEEPTSKRKQEARNKGQVAKSIEVNSVFVLLAAFMTLKILGSFIYTELGQYMQISFSNFPRQDFTIEFIREIFIGFGMVILKTSFPIMCVILLVSLMINFLQVGFMFTLEPLMPSLDKINPLSGFSRLFSKRSLVELAKALIKIIVVGYFVYNFMLQEAVNIPSLVNTDLVDALQYTGNLILQLVYKISEVLIVLAALDYYYQWWSQKESLKMSKQEVKEEFKQMEGDPLIKGKIKQRQRAMAMRRMMQDVPKADVIVTNPTHYAVALKYEKGMAAPQIVAKGQDFIAQKIKEIARHHKVVIVENKMLARSLYATAEVGDIVPPELYQAVAEVLAYVYRLKKRLS